MARGAAWMVLLRVMMRVLSVVNQLVVVRLLTPDDFGIVAASSVALAVMNGLTEASLGLALVQMRDPERHHYNTAWTLLVIRGLLVGGVLWCVAPLMADYMRDERVTDVVRVFAIVPMVQGFESIGMIRMQRNLMFSRVFAFQLAGRSVGFLVMLPLAIIYENYWALVLGGVVSRLGMLPLSYVIAPYRPGFSLRGFREMFNFSKLMLLTNILTMADIFMIPLIFGRIGTMRDVGLYQVSRDLAALPASEIAAPIRGPMIAGYARVAHDARLLRHQMLTGLGFLVMIIVPMSAGIAVTAPYVVDVALGPQWSDAAPVLVLTAIYTLFDALGHSSGGVYLARNAQAPYVRIMAGCLLLRLSLVLPAAILGGLAWAIGMMALTAIVSTTLWFGRLRPLTGVSWTDLISPVWRSFAAAGLMVVAVLTVELCWPPHGSITAKALQWAFVCGLGAVVHIATQYCLWRWAGSPDGPEAQLIRKAGPRVSALLARFGLPRG